MTEFEKTYQNYNPRQAALDEARALLTAAAKAAMADGTLPEAGLPAFILVGPRALGVFFPPGVAMLPIGEQLLFYQLAIELEFQFSDPQRRQLRRQQAQDIVALL